MHYLFPDGERDGLCPDRCHPAAFPIIRTGASKDLHSQKDYHYGACKPGSNRCCNLG